MFFYGICGTRGYETIFCQMPSASLLGLLLGLQPGQTANGRLCESLRGGTGTRVAGIAHLSNRKPMCAYKASCYGYICYIYVSVCLVCFVHAFFAPRCCLCLFGLWPRAWLAWLRPKVLIHGGIANSVGALKLSTMRKDVSFHHNTSIASTSLSILFDSQIHFIFILQ